MRGKPLWALIALFAAGMVYAVCSSASTVILPYFLWAIPSNSLLMIPTEPAALAAVQFLRPAHGLIDAAVLVAGAGTIGAGIACILDYTVLRWATRRNRIQRALRTSFAQRVIRWFNAYPFVTVASFASFPLPFFIIRFVAVAAEYPMERYTSAMMVGKFVRLMVLGILGGWWILPRWIVVSLLVLVLGVLILAQARLMLKPAHASSPEVERADGRIQLADAEQPSYTPEFPSQGE